MVSTEVKNGVLEQNVRKVNIMVDGNDYVLKLTKNQRKVANNRILSVLVTDKNLSLKESVQRANDPILTEAFDILTAHSNVCRQNKIIGKSKGAYLLKQVQNIENPSVRKQYSQLLDVYHLNTIKEGLFELGIMKFDLSQDGTENILTFGIKTYFSNGEQFAERTLGQFVVPSNMDKFGTNTSLTEISDREWNTITKIKNTFLESKTQYESIDQIANMAGEYIANSTAKRHAVKESVKKYAVEF